MTQAEMCQEDKVGGRSHKRWLGADCQNWDTADDDGDVDEDVDYADDEVMMLMMVMMMMMMVIEILMMVREMLMMVTKRTIKFFNHSGLSSSHCVGSLNWNFESCGKFFMILELGERGLQFCKN